MGILHLGERQRFRLFVRRDPFERFLAVPHLLAARDLHDRAARSGRRLQAFNGTSSEFNVHLSESVLARVMIACARRQEDPRRSTCASLRPGSPLAARRWDDDLNTR